MFCINVALGSTSWRLLFQHEDKAKTCFATLDKRFGGDMRVEDDFGQTLVVHTESMHGLMFEDL